MDEVERWPFNVFWCQNCVPKQYCCTRLRRIKICLLRIFFLLTASTPATPPQQEATNKEEIDKKSKLTPCLEDFGLSSYTLNMLNRPSQAQQAEFKVPGAAVPERFGFWPLLVALLQWLFVGLFMMCIETIISGCGTQESSACGTFLDLHWN